MNTSIDLVNLRSKAETKLANGKAVPKRLLDPRRLVHELQVHELELEMQNEELIAANNALEMLRAKYQALYNAAPVGYFTLSETGLVLDFNSRAAAMLGRASNTIINLRLRDCFDSASLAAFDEFFAGVRRLGDEVSADNLLLQRPSTVPIYVRAQGRSLRLGAGAHDAPVVLVVLMDVSVLKYTMDDVLSVIQK